MEKPLKGLCPGLLQRVTRSGYSPRRLRKPKAIRSLSPTQTHQEPDFLYEPGPDGATLTRYTGWDEDLIVLEVLGGQPVTRIGDFGLTQRSFPR